MIAHIKDEKTQSIKEHLINVAASAKKFAEEFGSGNYAYQIGMAHDIGKYSDLFQKKITENLNIHVDHSTAGARELFQRKLVHGAFAVAGHHGGLPDGRSNDESCLVKRLNERKLEDYTAYEKEVQFDLQETKDIERCVENIEPYKGAFFTRMLFSCLVDADFLDTEKFMQNGMIVREGYDDVAYLKRKLDDYISGWLNHKDAAAPLNRMRTEILEQCLKKGKKEKGLYSLTVPTGAGKTISSLAFALQHAAIPEHNIRRIIYVIPYTSIIEQNAEVFRKILGDKNVVEHHANVVLDGEQEGNEYLHLHHLSTENWDAPLIVTTNIQFFESLYGNKPSVCRKLHNIANSVVIFDEAQMIPLKYLKPCVRTIKELVEHYGVTAVLCTATQPALQRWFLPLKITEICDNYRDMFRVFKRAEIKSMDSVTEEKIVEIILQYKQVLLIVNTKKRAQDLFAKMKERERSEIKGNFHLSTNMTPWHRSEKINEIKDRLADGKICRVVSTSLIEAGVDIDFPCVYREIAGIDSVIQAAGRCNREGKRETEESIVHVFSFEDGIPKMLEKNISMTKESIAKNDSYDSTETVEYYFEHLQKLDESYLDQKGIIYAFEKHMNGVQIPFKSVAEQFRLIEEDTRMIIVPVEEMAQKLLKKLRVKLEEGISFKSELRNLGRYSVNVRNKYYFEMKNTGVINEILDGVAVLQDLTLYDSQVGLNGTTGRDVWIF